MRCCGREVFFHVQNYLLHQSYIIATKNIIQTYLLLKQIKTITTNSIDIPSTLR